MAETVRDILIKIAIEQKQVVLKTPDFKPMTAAAAAAGQSASDAISAKMDAGIKEVEKELRELDAQLDRSAKNRETATLRSIQLNRQAASQQSAVLGAIGESIEATARLAKGVAFLSAANEEDAAAMVRKIAAYQGYFDVVSGGVHVIKSIGDIQRQTALFMTATAAAESAVAAGSVPAIAGLEGVAAAGTTVTVSLGPLTIAAAAVAAAGYLVYQNWKYWSDLAKKDLIPSAEVMTNKFNVMAASAQASAQAASALAGARVGGNADSTQNRVEAFNILIAAQEKLGQKTAEVEASSQKRQKELEAGRRQGMISVEQILNEQKSDEERLNDLRKAAVELEQQKQELIKGALQQREQERDRLMQINQAAQQVLATEENRNRSENIRLGLLTRSQQMQAKALLDKKASGQELSQTDIRRAQRFGILNSSVEAFGQNRADESGLSASRVAAGETQPLEAARRNAASSQKVFQDAANEINKEIDKLNDANKSAANRIVQAFKNLADGTATLGNLAAAIEKIERDKKNEQQIGRKN